MVVKFLNSKEIRTTFRRNIHKKDVMPVFVVIVNKTNNLYSFKKELITQTLFTANEVAEKGKFQVFWRALIFSPFTICILFWPLLLPAIIDGLGAVEANKLMREDYVRKELIDMEIRPQELLSGFLYFDKRCIKVDNKVGIKLRNLDTDKIVNFEFNYNSN